MNKNIALIVAFITALVGMWLIITTTSKGMPTCQGCNVIIIGVDTLRADELHALGYERNTTPTLDTLAQHGALFSNAISASSWTVPSFMSIFTSTYPSVHKVTNKFSEFSKTKQVLTDLSKLSPQIETLAQVMKQNGYVTGGFTGDAGVSGKFGYSKGFDTYTDETKFGGLENSESHALQWLDGLKKGQKFFMFFHGYDLHGQFDLPAGEKGTFVPTDYKGPYKGTKQEEAKLREQQLEPSGITLTPQDAAFWKGIYDSKVTDADARLGRFVEELQKRGLMKNTVIIVVSDHGEEYYEHGGIDHGHSLYDELVHVPLIVDIPGWGGVRIDAQVTMMDVAPTLFDIVGVQASQAYAKQMVGEDLMPYLNGAKKSGQDVFTETDYRNAVHLRSVRTNDGWKYILNLDTKKEELYDLRSDPGEKTNLADKETAKKDALRRELLTHMRDDLNETLDMPLRHDCLPVYDGECI